MPRTRRRWIGLLLVLPAAAVFMAPAERVSAATSSPTGTGVTFSATEGATFSGVLAHFTNVNTTNPSPSATIDWGDGTTTAATLTSTGGTDFDVSGSHAYSEEGTAAVTVDLSAGNGAASANSTAEIADAPLTVTGVPLNAQRAVPFANQTVATFTDADPGGALGDYTATIDWGDGTSTAGTVFASRAGGFVVDGGHSYDLGGSYAVRVTVHDAGGAAAAAQTTAGVTLPGGEIAFIRNQKVWLMHADGTGQAQLTANTSNRYYNVAWSPGGGRLASPAVVTSLITAAFQAVTPFRAPLYVRLIGVWTMNADGTAPAFVAPTSNVGLPGVAPDWSSTGGRIAYVDHPKKGLSQISTVPASGVGLSTPLTAAKGAGRNFSPAWSPKGDRIAFASTRGGGTSQLFTMAPNGGGQTQLLHSAPRVDGDPAWSPDATRIAFTGGLPGDFDHVYVMDADGTNVRMLTPTVGDSPTWSPEGTRIAFAGFSSSGARQIRVINVDGTGEHVIADNADAPAWRPSGCDRLRICLLGRAACALCPALQRYNIRYPAFRVGPKATAVVARRVHVGTAFVYTLSARARVGIRIIRVSSGHRVGRRCAAGAGSSGATPCLRTAGVGTLIRSGRTGSNTTTFSGRIGRRALRPGHYEAVITAVDARGRRSTPVVLDFDVLP